MSFLAPLGFLAALALPIITALWMLKLRRRRLEVPSTLLWQRAVQDFAANSPLQRLRTRLLLLLQLLAALLVMFALARPMMQGNASDRRPLVLLIDRSASMSTADGGGKKTRLDQARAAALARMDGLTPGQEAMVIAFAARAEVVVPLTADRRRLRAGIEAISPSDLPTNIADALSLAASLARPARGAVVVLSDGAFDAASVRIPPDLPLDFVSFGKSTRNVGITAVDLRRPADAASADADANAYQVFVNIRNAGTETITGRLEIRAGDRLLDARTLEAKASSDTPFVFTQGKLPEGSLELRLDVQDDLAADNVAYVAIQPPRRRKLQLVSAGNYFLERVLRLDPQNRVELTRILPQDWRDDSANSADLTVFDGTCPAKKLPPGAYMFVNCLPPLPGFEVSGVVDSPAILDWNAASPVLRHVDFGDVDIRRALRMKLPAAAQLLAEGKDTPLVALYGAGGISAVIWTFDVFDTNLPLRVAFPILTSNCIAYLLQGARSADAVALNTGKPLEFFLPAEVDRGLLTLPGGKQLDLIPNEARRAYFDRADLAGVYSATWKGAAKPQIVGVSLLSERETDVAPAASLATQDRKVESKGSLTTGRELWRWAALAALLIVMLEWTAYHRRWGAF